MASVDTWQFKEVQRWRNGAAIAWSALLSPVLLFVCTSFANVDILHPWTWVKGQILTCFDLSCWMNCLLLSGTIVLTAFWNSHQFTVRPQILANRFSYIWNVLCPRRIVHAGRHALAAAIIAWCYTNCIPEKYAGLSYKCPHDAEYPSARQESCLNERHVFLVLHCALVGCVSAVCFFVYQRNHLTFCIIQQSKFFQVKLQIISIVKEAVVQVITPICIYYLAYYILLGPLIADSIANSLNLKVRTENRLHSIAGLLDFSLLWHTVLSGTLVVCLFELSHLLQIIYHTEHFEFPILSNFDGDENKSLHRAISSTEPLLKYLGYLDLWQVSCHYPSRRSQLFSLSQPGGHPHNWRAVSTECLGLLHKLHDDLNMHNNTAFTTGPLRQPSGDKTQPFMSKDTGNVLIQRNIGVNVSAMAPPGGSFLNQSQTAGQADISHTIPLKKMSTHQTDSNSNTTEGEMKPGVGNKVWNLVKKMKIVSFFATDLPETSSLHLFQDCQLHIWAVEALSNFGSASFQEDKFGVVQKSLADIISILLLLQEAMEKHFKLAGNMVKKGNSQRHSALVLRFALRSKLKTALYRLVAMFGSHLSSIDISPEQSRRLKLFMEYKE